MLTYFIEAVRKAALQNNQMPAVGEGQNRARYRLIALVTANRARLADIPESPPSRQVLRQVGQQQPRAHATNRPAKLTLRLTKKERKKLFPDSFDLAMTPHTIKAVR